MKKKVLLPILVVALAVLTAIPALPAQAAPADGGLPTVTWLPPLSNQGEFQLKDGSTLPIKFTLTDPDTGAFVEDTDLRVDVSEVLFRDDFNDGDADGWTAVAGDDSWSVVDSVLRCDPDIQYPRILADETMEYTDYVFEADARLISGPGYALLFRATDSNNFYSFQYDPGLGFKLRLYQFTNFPAGADVAPPVPYSTDYEWHHLKVAVLGNNIKCYVDGYRVFNVTDTVLPAPTQGGIGFRTWVGAQAEFDNVMVVSLPAAESFAYGTGGDNVRIAYDTIFSDDFERADIGPNWQWVSGTWAIEDDSKDDIATRVLSGEGGLYVGEVAGVSSWDSYIFEFDVKKVSGSYFQVVFGYQDLNHHYLLEPSSDQVHIALFKKTGGGYIEMTATRPLQETNPGVWYHYKIVFTPSNIQIYCNGIEKFNVATDPSLTNGRIGVGAGIWGSSHAHFDNVMVQAPHYIANLHTKESGMTTGEHLITVWSGSGDQLGTYLFDLTDAIQGMGRGKGKA